MKHPCKEYENTEVWKTVKSSVEELVNNNDVELLTPTEWFVGYINISKTGIA